MSNVTSDQHYRVLGRLLALAVVAGIALSACSTPSAAPAQVSDDSPASTLAVVETGQAQASDGSPARSLTVVGTGSVSAVPDLATAQIGVDTQAASPQAATRQNDKRVQAVVEALKAAGIAEADIQDAHYNLYAEQRYDPATGQATGQFTYRVSASLSVKIRELAKVGAVLGDAVKAGANNISGVYFSIEDTASLQAAARAKAVADAKARAQALAQLSGVQLGEVVGVSEVITGVPGPVYYEAAARVGLGGGGGAPIQPGQLEVSMQVQMSFAIR